MPRQSAGLLMYRRKETELQVFLVHPGGPYWAHKDLGAWSIPKGEYPNDEPPLTAAQREFHEETGFTASGPFLPLTPLKQPSGKLVAAWAFEGDADPAAAHSNTFSMEWPPHSGKRQKFPEVDRAEWFGMAEAHERILVGQRGFLTELVHLLAEGTGLEQ